MESQGWVIASKSSHALDERQNDACQQRSLHTRCCCWHHGLQSRPVRLACQQALTLSGVSCARTCRAPAPGLAPGMWSHLACEQALGPVLVQPRQRVPVLARQVGGVLHPDLGGRDSGTFVGALRCCGAGFSMAGQERSPSGSAASRSSSGNGSIRRPQPPCLPHNHRTSALVLQGLPTTSILQSRLATAFSARPCSDRAGVAENILGWPAKNQLMNL